MSDTYTQIVNAPVLSNLASSLGLPQPVELDRFGPGQPVIKGPVLTSGAPEGRLRPAISAILDSIGAERAGLEGPAKALVFDATGIADSTQLVELQRFFYPAVPRLSRSGRAIVLGSPPRSTGGVRAHTAQRALEGFVRSLGKEIGGRGSTAQLVQVEPGAEGELESTLRYLLSPRSAFVSGQVIRVGVPVTSRPDINWDLPLAGLTALVTGASRGIGES
ncbi:MAG TPA: short chain dehydrogenase, partial [Solirubrobacterales bacterium]|nr:short chain dehydrogenase [Solirubrobacterales bacterium]